MIRPLIAICFMMAAAMLPAAETPAPGARLKSLLSPDEYKSAGLEKLTPDELGALEAALAKHHALPKPKNSFKFWGGSTPPAEHGDHTAASDKARDDAFGAEQLSRPKSADTPDELHSRIEGTLQEFSGRAVFVLENGQVWQQRTPQSYYFAKKLVNPEVVITKGLGGYKMVIVPADAVVLVKRIQ